MPIVGVKTNLSGVTRANDTLLFIDASLPQFSEAFDAPSHLFMEIYTTRYSEMVVAYKVDHEDGKSGLRVQRGMSGTEARSWPDDACIRVVEQVNGTLCAPETEDGAGDSTDLTQTILETLLTKETITRFFEAFSVGEGLTLDLTSADAPKISLAPTGVTPGDYGGAQINKFGQVVSAPENWPASAVPNFDPCGCD